MIRLYKKHKVHFMFYSALCLIVLYAAVALVSESNAVCSSCHGDLKEAWAHSTHSEISCRQCHVEPGARGQLKAHTEGMHNLWVSITRGNDIQPHEDPVPIKSQQCLVCHASALSVNELGHRDLPENSLKDQGLVVAHRLHVEDYEISCVECHRGVTHRDPEEIGKYRTNWPLMHKDCGVCHDGKYWERFDTPVTDLESPANCTVCHPRYRPLEKASAAY